MFERLKDVTHLVEYASFNSRLHSLDANYDICQAFARQEFAYNRTDDWRCMVLGWNSIGIFDNNLKLEALYTAGYSFRGNEIPRTTYAQVVTRAVATCTFAHIRVGGYHVLAHLDDDFLEWGKNIIENFMMGRNVEKVGFCSHIKGEDEDAFSLRLRELCGENRYQERLRHRDVNYPNPVNDLYGHMEIGLGRAENGQIVLFGDITDNCVEHCRDRKYSATRLFDSQEMLMRINLNGVRER